MKDLLSFFLDRHVEEKGLVPESAGKDLGS